MLVEGKENVHWDDRENCSVTAKIKSALDVQYDDDDEEEEEEEEEEGLQCLTLETTRTYKATQNHHFVPSHVRLYTIQRFDCSAPTNILCCDSTEFQIGGVGENT
jgi:hypothetical protein